MKQLLCLSLFIGTTLLSCKLDKPIIPETITVTIDGTAYPTIKIGSQTWTSVNYNGTGGVNYNNSTTNGPANGKLYTLTEAKAISLPTGWRIPTQEDYGKLLASQGATIKDANGYYTVSAAVTYKLMSKTGWSMGGGANTSGFNALPVGYYNKSAFGGTGTDAVFLTTSNLTQYPTVPASFNIYQDVENGNDVTNAILTDYVVLSTDRASLRFVKDN